MSDQPNPAPPVDEAYPSHGPAGEPNELLDIFRELCIGERRRQLPAEFARFPFTAAEPEVRDDLGSPCLSYAIYNPNEFRVYVAFGGGPARSEFGAFPVPKQKLVVIPVAIAGHVQLAADATELGEKSGAIWRCRFAVPQPFFAAALV